MKRAGVVLFPLILLAYVGLFLFQEKMVIKNLDQLTTLPSYRFFQAVSGYARQLCAESIYIKTSVYLGGTHKQKTLKKNEKNLADHFVLVSKLHPKFRDTYFLCEGFLPSISKESAARANDIIGTGQSTYPDFWLFDIFAAFNCFYYLDDHIKAASILNEAVQKPGAPSWLGRLASVLAAQGGELYTGLNWLKLMRSGEKDDSARARYDKDIRVFEQAISVQQAADRYANHYGKPPEKLEELVPEFLSEIPDPGKNFVYDWVPPTLKLKRPKTMGVR